MTYLADPGGVFASDTHRRTLGHLPLPDDSSLSVDGLVERMGPDAHTSLDVEGAEEVLGDLEADGHAANLKDGWKLTKAGLAALNAPIPEGDEG